MQNAILNNSAGPSGVESSEENEIRFVPVSYAATDSTGSVEATDGPIEIAELPSTQIANRAHPLEPEMMQICPCLRLKYMT